MSGIEFKNAGLAFRGTMPRPFSMAYLISSIRASTTELLFGGDALKRVFLQRKMLSYRVFDVRSLGRRGRTR